MAQAALKKDRRNAPDESIDWKKVVQLLLLSRALDEMEEQRLVPEKKILYQFSARGHDMAQILLGLHLTGRHDAACGYYRSRPLLLALGVDPADALGSAMGRAGGYSDGRDIGVVFNYPNPHGASALPMCGGVGTQYTPTAGWAQAITYFSEVLGKEEYQKDIAVVLGGDGSVASNGFWSALTIATTQGLPLLFYIEDNGFGISVPSSFQTPEGNIAGNLAGWKNLTVLDGDGSDPEEAARLTKGAVELVREGRMPVLLRLEVPRLEGHSFQDTQTYKSEELVRSEWAHDPLPRLRDYIVPAMLSAEEWNEAARDAKAAAERARVEAESRPVADPETVTSHVFFEGRMQVMGGQHPAGYRPPKTTETATGDGQRINMVTAIRRTLDHEMTVNQRVVLFGEDIGPKGGVHAVTLGLQEKFGTARVFDTSLSEEGIIGRAVGMALAGLVPVPEIQFRKYAEPAIEQLNDCGTIRWRTSNRFAAPIVVRMAGGILQMRRSVAQPDERGRLRPPARLEDRRSLQCRGRRWAPAHRLARQRSGDLLRAPGDARPSLGAAALSRRCIRPALRQREIHARRPRHHHRHLGRHGAALRRGGRGDLSRRDRSENPDAMGQESGHRIRAPHPPVPHRPRGPRNGGFRRGDCRSRRRRSLHRSRRADLAPHHAGYSQPP